MSELLQNEARDLFEKIKDFDLSNIIARHRKDDDISYEESVARSLELKRWLVLAKVNQSSNYQLTGPIDNIWHTFIMFTKDYEKFCEQLGGFIHHVPADHSQLIAAKSDPELLTELNNTFNADYGSVLSDYEGTFQETPPVHIWPNIANPFGRDTSDGDHACGSRCGCVGQCGPN